MSGKTPSRCKSTRDLTPSENVEPDRLQTDFRKIGEKFCGPIVGRVVHPGDSEAFLENENRNGLVDRPWPISRGEGQPRRSNDYRLFGLVLPPLVTAPKDRSGRRQRSGSNGEWLGKT